MLYFSDVLCLDPDAPITQPSCCPVDWEITWKKETLRVGVRIPTLHSLELALGEILHPRSIAVIAFASAGINFHFLSIVVPDGWRVRLRGFDGHSAREFLTTSRPSEIAWGLIRVDVLRHTRRLVCDFTESEDMAQEVILRIYQRIHTFRGSNVGALRAWIRETCVNHCFNRSKARKRATDMFVAGAEIEAADENAGVGRLHRGALGHELLGKLSSEDALLATGVAQGYTFEELAVRLGIRRQRVHDRWKAIIGQLRRAINAPPRRSPEMNHGRAIAIATSPG